MVETKDKEMRFACVLLLLMAALLSGCARHYRISLNNGSQIETRSKPHFKDGVYYYNDAAGHKAYVPAGAVREIAPASMAKEGDTLAKPKITK